MAANATWELNGNGDYNDTANWDPDGPPTDTATFGTTNQSAVAVTSSASVGAWSFADGQDYGFTIDAALDFSGAGIEGDGAGAVSIINNSTLTFFNASAAGAALITTMNGATTQFLNNSNGGSAAFAAEAGGTVDFSATTGASGDGQIAAASIAGAGSYDLGANTLTVGNSDDQTVSGVISGEGGSLNKVGTGALTLTAVNTYSGATIIETGATIALSGDGSLENSSVTSNGTFDISALSGTGPFDNANTSIRSLDGGGSVVLGDTSLELTDASGLFVGTIAGDDEGELQISGGTLTLAGVNTYTGGTVVGDGATLKLEGAGSIKNTFGVLLSGTLDISGVAGEGASIGKLGGFEGSSVVLGDKTLTVSHSNATDEWQGVISGTGGLVLDVSENFWSANTYTGSTLINGGADLLLVDQGSIAQSSVVTVEGSFDISGLDGDGASIMGLAGGGSVNLGGKQLGITGAGNNTFAGIISGSGGLTLTGGVQTLSNFNTYTGATLIAGGTLVLSGIGSIAPSSVLADGTFDISDTVGGDSSILSLDGGGSVILGGNVLNLTDANGAFSGAITGEGGLTVAAGLQELSGANTYTGATTINAGATLALIDNGSIAESSAVTANGVFDISGTSAAHSIMSLDGSATGSVMLGGRTLTLSAASGIFDGVISGGEDSEFAVSGGTQTLTGLNTHTGATTIDDGATLALDFGGSIANSLGVVADGIFDVSQVTAAGASITSLSGNGGVNLGDKTLTLTDANDVFSGVLEGTGGLTVASGLQFLTGVSTYTGATTVAGANLVIAAGGNIEASSHVFVDGVLEVDGIVGTTTVNDGGVLQGEGTTGAVAVDAGGTLGPGSTVGILSTASVTFASGASFTVELDGPAAGTGYDQLDVSGTVELGGATLLASLGFKPKVGDGLVIVDNDGGDAVSGTFAGLNQGAKFKIGSFLFTIDYGGGDGNDVALTAVGQANRGTEGADTVRGGDGDDRLVGLGGPDLLRGGAGDDILIGGAHADTLNGGAGQDFVAYWSSSAGVIVNLASGAFKGSDAEGDTATGIEHLIGSSFNDRLAGDGLDNMLRGREGDDTLNGCGGNDTLAGKEGNDRLAGGAGDDLLAGKEGDDRLIGGAGVDRLAGGDGDDTFIFASAAHSAVGAANAIFDFAEGDLLDLAGIDADTGLAGDQAFALIGDAAFSGEAGELRAFLSGSTGIVTGDLNGDGAADFRVRFANGFLIDGDDLIA